MHCYTFLRTDIPLADQIVQASHSAIEAGRELQIPSHCNLVLLQIENEKDLLDTACFLLQNGIRYEMFFEPDDNMGHTSITTEALTDEKRKLLSKFKLWRCTK